MILVLLLGVVDAFIAPNFSKCAAPPRFAVSCRAIRRLDQDLFKSARRTFFAEIAFAVGVAVAPVANAEDEIISMSQLLSGLAEIAPRNILITGANRSPNSL